MSSIDERSDAEDLFRLATLAQRYVWGGPDVHRYLQANGVSLTPANFYASVPKVEDVEASWEYLDDAPYDGGLFDQAGMAERIRHWQRFADEFDPPTDGDQEHPAGFFWLNDQFGYTDAMAYWCMLREIQPDHVLEVGAGFSTLVADAALRANGHGRITVIEPHPRSFLRDLPTVTDIRETFVQRIPLAEMTTLVESADVWFIDSTHTVKIGSDCLYLYLRVMPALDTEVIVHSHDVFLPFAPPRHLALDLHIYWTEQYLLYAYLLDNPRAQVTFGSAYAAACLPDEMALLMGGKQPIGGVSLWYELRPRR